MMPPVHGQLRLLPVDLTARRIETAPGTSLAPLIDGLARELEPLLAGNLPIPERKARLTRVGGRCPVHGVLLDFDPWSPHDHRCPQCHRTFQGLEHDDWWAMGAQLYTAERAVHAAALFALRGDARHAALSGRILTALASRYAQWPNRDNALGPSRPFFSTYLESIWLLNICHALDLLETATAPHAHALGTTIREQLIAPSAALISAYDEGTSNRQVWNEVAILSALRLLHDDLGVARRLDHEQRFTRLLQHGVLEDGTWYEGENYHLFAHRGLWYGMQLLHTTGREIPATLADRYAAGFVSPFLGLLPDETFPSRRDSQFAVSIRQWRVAEWCELGFAYRPDHRLAGLLSRIYDGSVSTNREARARSTADAERNDGPSALSRADLSWRALLLASPQAVPDAHWAPSSVCLPSQGLAVVRRERGHVYVALEGGHTGSGHGHPDRLALSFHTGAERWLQDPGTGSYVERLLFWYRSTLAHHAPLVNGASQPSSAATLLAFEDRGGFGWMRKRADIGAGIVATRTVVVCEGYLVDVLEWQRSVAGDEPITITLPLCGDASLLEPDAFQPDVRRGAGGLEDGFEFLGQTEAWPVPRHADGRIEVRLQAGAVSSTGQQSDHARARLHLASSVPAVLLRARAPGAPGCPTTRRHAIELQGNTGRLVSVWDWRPQNTTPDGASSGSTPIVERSVLNALDAKAPVARVTTSDGTTAVHGGAPHGWHVELLARHARSSVDLEGLVAHVPPHEPPQQPPHQPPTPVASPPQTISVPWIGSLGEAHYLRTEPSWREAGAPTAVVQITATPHQVVIDVDVHGHPLVAPDPEGNLLDNEHADTNADGIQWYWGPVGGAFTQAALCVPVDHAVRMTRLVAGEWPLPTASARTRSDGDGWAVRFVWNRSDLPVDDTGLLAFDLIVNERPAERTRRRGQLVLSGRTVDPPLAAGFCYLRGDRHDPTRALRLQLPPR